MPASVVVRGGVSLIWAPVGSVRWTSSGARRVGAAALSPAGPLCSARVVTGTPTTGIYLARHGRTAYNDEGRFQGRLPVPLDELGLQQAAELGESASPYDF